MRFQRWGVAALSLACVAVVAAPGAAADLSVRVDRSSGFDIYVDGASTLNAPQNVTITAAGGAYTISWQPPTVLPTQDPVGYVLYRVPVDSSRVPTVAIHLDLGTTSVTDRWTYSATYVYFVATVYSGDQESIPSTPVTTQDPVTMTPHCSVVSLYTSPPYYSVQLSCLFSPT